MVTSRRSCPIQSLIPSVPTRVRQQAPDACTKPGELSALLRREGIYSSNLASWRQAREQGQLAALEPKKRGRKARQIDPRDVRIAELEKQLAKEQARRERAEALVELQKKVAALLGEIPKDETP